MDVADALSAARAAHGGCAERVGQEVALGREGGRALRRYVNVLPPTATRPLLQCEQCTACGVTGRVKKCLRHG